MTYYDFKQNESDNKLFSQVYIDEDILRPDEGESDVQDIKDEEFNNLRCVFRYDEDASEDESVDDNNYSQAAKAFFEENFENELDEFKTGASSLMFRIIRFGEDYYTACFKELYEGPLSDITVQGICVKMDWTSLPDDFVETVDEPFYFYL